MFTNKYKELKSLIDSRNISIENIGTRLNKIEEQLKPEPAFKEGDLVSFFLVGEEFEGEIVKRQDKYWFILGGNNEDPIVPGTTNWVVKYLDKNEVVQEVVVKEEDILSEDGNEISDIYNELFELRERIKELETKKK
jgi:hypothetical protein